MTPLLSGREKHPCAAILHILVGCQAREKLWYAAQNRLKGTLQCILNSIGANISAAVTTA